MEKLTEIAQRFVEIQELAPVSPPHVAGWNPEAPATLLEVSYLAVILSAALGNLATREDPRPLRALYSLLPLLSPEAGAWLEEHRPEISRLWQQQTEAMLEAAQSHPAAPKP